MSVGFESLITGDDAWRFPRLGLLSEQQPEAPDDACLRALAADLTADLAPDDAIAVLVEGGALNQAERAVGGLINQGCSEQWAESAYADIDEQESRRREGFERRRRAIAARCHRAGLDRPAELAREFDYRRHDGAFLDELFSMIEDEVGEAEAARSRSLRARCAGADLGERHRQDVEDLVGAGELRLAELALDAGGGRMLLPTPRLDERPWLDVGESLATIVGRLRDPAIRPTSYLPFVPAPGDVRGSDLVDALRRIADGEPGAEPVYAAAVQRLIANWEVQTEIVDGVTYASFDLPEVGRLPALRLRRGRDTVRFSVGAAGDAAFRLSTEVGDGAPGVIDVASLLGLLPQSGDGLREREDRLVLFYRAICRRLPVLEVVDAASFEGGGEDARRLRVAWLFYLMGYQITPQQLAAFMDLTGGIPELVVQLADLAVTRARARQSDVAVAAMYDDEELAARTLDAVAAELGDPAAELAVHLAHAGFVTPDAMHEELGRRLQELEQPVTARPRHVIDLPAALARARDLGLLTEPMAGADEMSPVAVGALLLLARDVVTARIDELVDLVAEAFRAERRRVAGERAKADLDEKAWHAQRSMECAALRGSTPDSGLVARCCSVALDNSREAHASVDMVGILDIEESLEVGVDGVMLYSAVLNLLNNAAESVHGRPSAQVRLTGTVAGGIVTIVVEDNGPGFVEHILHSFEEGAQAPSTKHPGRGSGLEAARSTSEELGGACTVGSSVLGGAEVVMRFPA